MVLEHGYTTGDDGNGFGLGSVRRLADLHGWTVNIEAGVAGGARFEITDAER
jgi:signal transduction histidine kinase